MDTNVLPDSAGPILLQHARAAVRDAFAAVDPADPGSEALPDWPEWADTQLGSFVTITTPGPDGHYDLRGCIGTLSDSRPLRESVPANALNAAFRDPRFPALTSEELPTVRFEVSVLSPAQPLAVSSEAEALAALRPGVDGVILTDGFRHATFLPQVWEELPDPQLFLAHLKHKAGLPINHWGPNTKLETYQAQAWTEPQPTVS